MTDHPTAALLCELSAVLQDARNSLDIIDDSLERLNRELHLVMGYRADAEGDLDQCTLILQRFKASASLVDKRQTDRSDCSEAFRPMSSDEGPRSTLT